MDIVALLALIAAAVACFVVYNNTSISESRKQQPTIIRMVDEQSQADINIVSKPLPLAEVYAVAPESEREQLTSSLRREIYKSYDNEKECFIRDTKRYLEIQNLEWRDDLLAKLRRDVDDERCGQIRKQVESDVKREAFLEFESQRLLEETNSMRKEIAGELMLSMRDDVRLQLRDELRPAVVTELKNELKDSLTRELYDQTAEEVRKAVYETERSAVLYQLRLDMLDTVRDSIAEEVTDQVKQEVRLAVYDDVRAELLCLLRDEIKDDIRQEERELIAEQAVMSYKQSMNDNQSDVKEKETVKSISHDVDMPRVHATTCSIIIKTFSKLMQINMPRFQPHYDVNIRKSMFPFVVRDVTFTSCCDVCHGQGSCVAVPEFDIIDGVCNCCTSCYDKYQTLLMCVRDVNGSTSLRNHIDHVLTHHDDDIDYVCTILCDMIIKCQPPHPDPLMLALERDMTDAKVRYDKELQDLNVKYATVSQLLKSERKSHQEDIVSRTTRMTKMFEDKMSQLDAQRKLDVERALKSLRDKERTAMRVELRDEVIESLRSELTDSVTAAVIENVPKVNVEVQCDLKEDISPPRVIDEAALREELRASLRDEVTKQVGAEIRTEILASLGIMFPSRPSGTQ